MKKKSSIFIVDNRIFEVIPCRGGWSFESGLVDVNIFEIVRPNWKIFRSRFIDQILMDMDEFETIEKGLYACLKKALDKRDYLNDHEKKWNDYLTN